MNIRNVAIALWVGVLLILSGCGGGGGGGDSGLPPPPSNNWDSMVWDQGKWG